MSVKHRIIFIVDDDELTSTMLSDHLKENPVNEVTIFSTGEDCIRNLTLDPDVIILDYTLNANIQGAADGLQILEHIKKIDTDVRVIMLSSQDDYGKALQTIMKGAHEYVIKDEEAFKRIDHILES